MSIHLRLIVQDRHGVLDRITGLIRRNGLNISEINAGEKGDGTSRINFRMKDKGADVHILGKALAQLGCVHSWEECNDKTHIVREMLLFSLCKRNYQEEKFPGIQLIEQCGDIIFFSYIASPSDIDRLLETYKELICDYSRGGALGVKKEVKQNE
jgi:acetolactate synthase small subunit